MGLLYLNLICNLSLVFSILNFSFSIIKGIYINEFIFPILLLTSYLPLYLRNRYRTLFYLFFLLYLIFIFISPSIYDKILLSIISFYIFNLLNKHMKGVRYSSSVEYFRKSIPLIILIIFISIILKYIPEKFLLLERFVIPYIVIYLITSVILLRTLRYLEYNPLDKKIIFISLRYAIITIFISIILSIPQIRETIFTNFLILARFIFSIFLSVIGLIFIILSYIFLKFLFFLFSHVTSKKMIKENPKEFQLMNQTFKNLMKNFNNKISLNFIDTLIMIIFSSLILLITIYIIFKFLKKEDSVEKREEIYKEEKEFLNPNINPMRYILKFLRRKESIDIIREYYKKYIKESIKRGVNFSLSDTTLDIYEKTKHIYDPILLHKIREIYVLVRYNLGKSPSKMAQEFIKLYKNLIKENRR